MIFSDITNSTGLVQDKARNMNNWYHKTINWILESQDGWDFDDTNNTDFPIATADLVAGQQDYALPLSDGILKIKRLEISYDGSKWNKAFPFDINESGSGTSTTDIANDFDVSNPYYDLLANSIFLYPIPDTAVEDGLKIWFARKIENIFTATGNDTRSPGIDEQFHRVISYGASYDWALTKTDGSRASAFLNEISKLEAEIKRFYGRKDDDRQIILKSNYVNYN